MNPSPLLESELRVSSDWAQTRAFSVLHGFSLGFRGLGFRHTITFGFRGLGFRVSRFRV